MNSSVVLGFFDAERRHLESYVIPQLELMLENSNPMVRDFVNQKIIKHLKDLSDDRVELEFTEDELKHLKSYVIPQLELMLKDSKPMLRDFVNRKIIRHIKVL